LLYLIQQRSNESAVLSLVTYLGLVLSVIASGGRHSHGNFTFWTAGDAVFTSNGGETSTTSSQRGEAKLICIYAKGSQIVAEGFVRRFSAALLS
jgi:hypothetical protein